mgnify:CR=1 FL=1
MRNRIKIVEYPRLTELSLGEYLLEIKDTARVYELSGDPEILDQLLMLIENVEIPILISETHIPYEAEA